LIYLVCIKQSVKDEQWSACPTKLVERSGVIK
jgi:hypothetical protein